MLLDLGYTRLLLIRVALYGERGDDAGNTADQAFSPLCSGRRNLAEEDAMLKLTKIFFFLSGTRFASICALYLARQLYERPAIPRTARYRAWIAQRDAIEKSR